MGLENIARRLKYPCANRQRGCREMLSIEHIAEHHAGCVYGKIKCPLHLLHTCFWNGFKNDLKEHVKEAHPKYLSEVSKFTSPYLIGTVLFVSCFGDLFTHYKQIRDGKLYAAVQLIGTSSEASKYKCEFTLRAANGIEQISKAFLVHGYSEDFEAIFNSGKCLKVPEGIIADFVKENQLNLTVTLSRVEYYV